MIKTFFYVVSFLVLLQGQSVFAHSSGHGPVSEKNAIMIASQITQQFTMRDPGLGFGKLNASWNELPAEFKRTHVKGEGYYIIALENKTESKTLYVLMSISGEVYDANLTGDFPALKKTKNN